MLTAALASLTEAQQGPDPRVADLVQAGKMLSRVFKHADLIYAATPDPTFELLRSGSADAFASVRPVLLAYSSKLPGSRVLEDHYGANLLGMVVAKGHSARLEYLSEFIEQANASGLLQQAIDRAGLPGHRVASAKTN
jgi:polar amino acid transport system substrate-binding protein